MNWPHGTKRTVFGASAHRLHRCPHIAVGRQQVPPSLLEVLRLDLSAVVDAFRSTGGAVTENAIPDDVAVASYDHMCAAVLKRLLRIKRGMDSPEHNPGAALPSRASHLVSSQGVAGVNANAHDVAWLNALQILVLEGFIADFGIPEGLGSRAGQHVKPSWGDDCSSEGGIAWINEVDAHVSAL